MVIISTEGRLAMNRNKPPKPQGGGGKKRKGQPVSAGPAPQAFIDALLFEGHSNLERPECLAPRGYSLVIGPQFDQGVILEACDSILNLTGGLIGFDPKAPNGPEVEFVFDPRDPGALAFLDRYGQLPIELCYRRHSPKNPNVLVGARIVYCLPDWLGSPKVARHGLGHFIGLCHAYREQWGDAFLMGNAPRDARDFNPWEREAWQYAVAHQPGYLRGTANGISQGRILSGHTSAVACSSEMFA